MKKDQGYSLVEAVVTVSVMATVFMMGKMGMGLINNFAHERSLVEIQRQAQLSLYQITKDIRNARSIIAIGPSRIDLLMYNTGTVGTSGYDARLNANLFNANAPIITYRPGTTPDGLTTLLREVDRPDTAPPSVDETSRNLSGTLVIPPDAPDMFVGRTVTLPDGTDVVVGASITITVNLPYRKGTKVYSAQVQRRGMF